jgi:hypothetical protein
MFFYKKKGRQMLREKNDPIDVKLTNLIRQFSTRNFGKSCRFLCKKNIICRILLLSAPGEQNIYPLPLKRQMVDPLPFLRHCWHHTAWSIPCLFYVIADITQLGTVLLLSILFCSLTSYTYIFTLRGLSMFTSKALLIIARYITIKLINVDKIYSLK